MARVVLAMSGGVDSSVAAHLLRRQGHEVIGLFMRHGHASTGRDPAQEAARLAGELPILPAPRPGKQGCCSAADALDARRVADQLGIPFFSLDFADAFAEVIDYFVDEYTRGRTPNPCVMCNNWIKFGKLLDYADSVAADYVATGHYARLVPGPDGQPLLAPGLDDRKDQSYVLFGIPRRQLARILFPVGPFEKPRIRQLATELGLRVADKPDSQEICFVPDGDHAGFIRRWRGDGPAAPGEFVDTAGRVLGRHRGIEAFTVGQRKGLGLAFGEPRYVVRLEPDTRRVVLGSMDDLAASQLTASGANWHIDPTDEPLACAVKIRYNSTPVAGTVRALPGQRLHVTLAEPRHAIAPGQAVVCYAPLNSLHARLNSLTVTGLEKVSGTHAVFGKMASGTFADVAAPAAQLAPSNQRDESDLPDQQVLICGGWIE